MDTDILALLIASGMIMFILLLAITWYVLLVIAEWKIFQKFGEPGWKSIIPFYNSYILYKYTWNVKMFAIMLGLAIFSGFASTFRILPLAFVGGLAGMACGIIGIMQSHKLSKAFGYDIAFTIGLVLLNNIFLFILGFGKCTYIGNSTEPYGDSYSEY